MFQKNTDQLIILFVYICIVYTFSDHERCRNAALACRLSSCKQASSSGIGHFTVVDSAMVEVATNERKPVQKCKIPLLFFFFCFFCFLETLATLHPNDLICWHSQAADLGHNFFLEVRDRSEVGYVIYWIDTIWYDTYWIILIHVDSL